MKITISLHIFHLYTKPIGSLKRPFMNVWQKYLRISFHGCVWMSNTNSLFRGVKTRLWPNVVIETCSLKWIVTLLRQQKRYHYEKWTTTDWYVQFSRNMPIVLSLKKFNYLGWSYCSELVGLFLSMYCKNLLSARSPGFTIRSALPKNFFW